ncbi:hypothetical protein AL506_006620 [Streptococcus sp. FDAARGOS_146]|nr:hypothetical protein AL506_006620 [Streptococcus sp. FDAARGOS_146]
MLGFHLLFVLNLVLLTIEKLYLILYLLYSIKSPSKKFIKFLNGSYFVLNGIFTKKNSTLVIDCKSFPKQNVYLIDESHRLSK